MVKDAQNAAKVFVHLFLPEASFADESCYKNDQQKMLSAEYCPAGSIFKISGYQSLK